MPGTKPSSRTGDARREDASSDRRSLFRKDGKMIRIDPFEVPNIDRSSAIFGDTTATLAKALPESDARRQQHSQELQAAGYQSRFAWYNLAALRYALVVGSILFLGVLLLFVPAGFEPWVIGALVAVPLLMWSLPVLFVRGKATSRTHEIEQGIPDLLDMLNMCVSQGMTIKNALARVTPDFEKPWPALASELQIVNAQAEVGTLSQALRNFDRRIDIPEVRSLTSLLIQSEKMGTGISVALDEHSENIREQQRQRADSRANSAAFRMLFPTVLCLMPAVFLILLGPSVIELARFLSPGSKLDSQRAAAVERLGEATPTIDSATRR